MLEGKKESTTERGRRPPRSVWKKLNTRVLLGSLKRANRRGEPGSAQAGLVLIPTHPGTGEQMHPQGWLKPLT